MNCHNIITIIAGKDTLSKFYKLIRPTSSDVSDLNTVSINQDYCVSLLETVPLDGYDARSVWGVELDIRFDRNILIEDTRYRFTCSSYEREPDKWASRMLFRYQLDSISICYYNVKTRLYGSLTYQSLAKPENSQCAYTKQRTQYKMTATDDHRFKSFLRANFHSKSN